MNRIEGNSQEFIKAVQTSPLSNSEKELLTQFLNRFPEGIFYRFTDVDPNKYPQWLKTYRETLDGFFFGRLRWLLFSEEAKIYPNTTLFTEEEYWYSCKFSPKLSSEYEAVFLEDNPLIIIAYYPKTADSYLAIKAGVNSTDKSVYDFSAESLSKNQKGQWEISSKSVTVAFSSLAEMYSQVVAIRGDDILLRVNS